MSTKKREFCHKRSSKSKIVQCRVEDCKQQVREQNYPRHLKTNHPTEDSRDLRVYGVEKFSWGKSSTSENADLSLGERTLPVGDALPCQPEGDSDDDDHDDEEKASKRKYRDRDRSWHSEGSGEEEDEFGGRKAREIQIRQALHFSMFEINAFSLFYRDEALTKFAKDVDEDKAIKETGAAQDLLLSIGWKRILVSIKGKMGTVEILDRSQLLSLYTTLLTIHRVFEAEEEQAREDLFEMMKIVVENLGSRSISWSNLENSEVEGVRLLIETVEVPAFAENLVKEYLSKVEARQVDENRNVEPRSDEVPSDIVDKVLDSMGLEVAGGTSTVKKLELMVKNAEVIKAVRLLEPLVEDLKKVSLDESTSDRNVGVYKDVKELMKKCRTVSDILRSFPEFVKEGEDILVCFICKRKFNDAECSNEIGDSILSRKFRNLKIVLTNHMESNVHKAESAMKVAVEALEAKQDSRVTSIGLVLGSICYLILKRGRPYEDFTDLVSLLAKFGVDVGDINHSFNFAGKFRKRAAGAIQRRWKKHLSNRCPQTGCLPPVKILADMATHQHWTRQAIGLAVLMPGSQQLIQTIILGFPRICKHDGESLSKNIAEAVDPFIQGEQYLGTSFDGAYKTSNVGEKLDKHFGGVEGIHDWDPVHAAATVDTAMRSDKESRKFGWLNKITQTISSCHKFINWGAEWDRFFKVIFRL